MALEAPSTPNVVRIIDSGPPKPPPAPTREIRVSQMTPSATPRREQTPPAKLDEGEERKSFKSTKELVKDGWEKYAKPTGEPVVVPNDPWPKKDAKKDGEEAGKAPEGEEGQEGEVVPQGTLEGKANGEKKAKPNPWKLYESEKTARAAAETEVQRLKSQLVPDQERSQIVARAEKAETRLKELEEIVRHKAYEESEEFKTKYHTPYENAWKNAITELSEITFTDPATGQERNVTSADINELVSLKLGAARKLSDELFGPFSDDVMRHRRSIKDLLATREAAITDARKNGGERERQMADERLKAANQTRAEIQQTWKAANDELMADPVNAAYFQPRKVEEGKEATPEEKDWNDALDRGFKLVDQAFAGMQLNSHLTPEQRKEMIKLHVALRNRAAAFGPLKRLTKRLEAQVDKLEKKLAGYSESTPGAGGQDSGSDGRPPAKSSGWQGIRESLKKYATK